MPTCKDYFPKICPKLGGASVRFNNPCAWAHGQAQMTAAHFTNMCKGATRMIHWHTQADEWGFVTWTAKSPIIFLVVKPYLYRSNHGHATSGKLG